MSSEQTLKQPWPTLRFVRPAPATRLPAVLSRDEVRRVLALVRIPVYRECLTTIYAGGLRLLEGARLQIADIDSGRMLFHSAEPADARPLSGFRGRHAGGGGDHSPPRAGVSGALR